MDAIHVQAPDGSVIQFPAGTPDATINSVMASEYGNKKAPEEKGALQSIREAVHAPTRILENGLFMGLGDRARAGMDAIIGKGDYGSNLKNEQGQTAKFEADHPIAAPVIGGVGSIAAPIGMLGAAGQASSLAGKVGYGAAAGAGIGGVQGGLASPDWTDLGQTAKDTGVGAGIGGLLGGSLPLAGKAIGSGYKAIADALTGTEGISRGASRHLIEALSADGVPAVQGKMGQLGSDAMLADAGPAFLGKAQGAALNSDEGRSVLANALSGRNEGTNQRIMGDVNRALGPAEDPQTVTNAIRAQRAEVDSKSYPAALSKAPAVVIDPVMADLTEKIAQSPAGSMEHRALTNLQKMLTREEQKAPVAGSPGAPVVPAAEDATTAALRSKYGDAVADAYAKQGAKAAPAEKPPQSLLEFLASKGGLGPDAELEAIGGLGHAVNIEGVGRRKLVKQGGWPLDYAREAAEEAGYLHGNHKGTSTVNDLLDVIDAEMRGQKRYPQGYEGHVGKREGAARSEREQHEFDRLNQGLEADLENAGHGQLGPDVKQRAIDLMRDKGLHPDEAVDRAVMQLDNESSFPGSKPVPAAAAAKSIPHDDANILHKIKGELDNIIQYDAPGLGVPAGALQRQQGALKQMRGAINNALEMQVPGYAAANRQSAAFAKRGEAVEAGTQYLGSGKTTPSPDRFAAEFDPLSQGEKIAFAKGSRGNIERVLGTKANDLQALRGELQGEGGWNTAKIGTVHGQEAADELAASVDRNLKFRDTHNKVVENSQTAQRQAAARNMKPEPSSETALVNPNMSMTGLLATGAKKAAGAALNAMRPDPTKSFGEVARVLSAQGSERDRHLMALVDALSRRQGHTAMAQDVGSRGALIAALLGNGYAQSHPSRNQSQ